MDLELGIPLGQNAQVAVGGENIFNTYPDVNQFGAMTVGNLYGQFSPFGFNGTNFYVRLNYGWGSGRPGRSTRAESTPELDQHRKRQEVAGKINELDALYDQLIAQLMVARDSETDAWLRRWAEEKIAKAQMAKEEDLEALRSGLASRAFTQDVEPLRRSADLKQHHVKEQIAAAAEKKTLIAADHAWIR